MQVLFLISLIMGLALGCLIGGAVLLVAKSITPVLDVEDAPKRKADRPKLPQWI